MYLIVGLGNPENEYAHTRHNMGFDTINEVAEKNNINITKSKFKGLYETGIIQGKKVILLKPQTYMNLSGNSVKEVVDFYKIEKDSNNLLYNLNTLPASLQIYSKLNLDSIVKEEDYYVIDDSQVVQQIWERLARLEGFVGGNGLDVYWIVLE